MWADNLCVCVCGWVGGLVVSRVRLCETARGDARDYFLSPRPLAQRAGQRPRWAPSPHTPLSPSSDALARATRRPHPPATRAMSSSSSSSPLGVAAAATATASAPPPAAPKLGKSGKKICCACPGASARGALPARFGHTVAASFAESIYAAGGSICSWLLRVSMAAVHKRAAVGITAACL